jgi:hypothetical protein
VGNSVYNIAHYRFIKQHINHLTISRLADHCGLTVKEVENAIVRINEIDTNYKTRFSVGKFNAAIKNLDVTGTHEKRWRQYYKEDSATIIRPPAEYSNTQWEDYKEQLLNKRNGKRN